MIYKNTLIVFLILVITNQIQGQGLTPSQAMEKMQVPPGMEVRLVASEPQIRQPLSMFFDSRGRLWVLQYLQYPNPAGLKALKQDQYLRTVWDKIPEPPPKGPKGADKITILYDRDEKGFFRKSKDFITGLNLASGMIWGHDGLFVVQPPYLLFYPDKNHDDMPDGDPQVLLAGFGMEDSHAYANSLQWGPDGWLYGAQGSTVTAKIRGQEFQQGIWRYHPITKEFELFSEGGGNTWGLDFDKTGQIIAGTNYGNFTMLHQVQGAYYVKGFSKHGPLHNPHTYGYFDHMPFKNFKGGHVTNGGIVYQADLYPQEYRNRYIAGNLLSNTLYFHDIETRGSTFAGKFGGDFLVANDPWFRPVDCFQGPEGAVYVADWHDKRAAHLDPVDNWDRTNGRIYKIVPKGFKEIPEFDLSQKNSNELIALLSHKNAWYTREARRLLAEKKDPLISDSLKKIARSNQGSTALEALWALAGTQGLEPAFLLELLDHPSPSIREWSVRLLADKRALSPAAITKLVDLARTETSPIVASQLACSARRLQLDGALQIAKALYHQDQFVQDPYIPMLLWWAVEDQAINGRSQILDWFKDPTFWQKVIVRQNLLERIARRWVSEGTEPDWNACAQLLTLAPNEEDQKKVLSGIEKALEGRKLALVPTPLQKPLQLLREKNPKSRELLRLAFRLGDSKALSEVTSIASSLSLPASDRIFSIELLGQLGDAGNLPVFLNALEAKTPDNVRLAAINAMQSSADDKLAIKLLELYPSLPANLKSKSLALLTQRPNFSLLLMQNVDAGKIPKTEVSIDLARAMASHKEEKLLGLLTKHFGKVSPPSPGEKIARISYVNLVINRTKPDIEKGKAHFQKQCANCHMLFGQGNKVGPDLTTADRQSLLPLITHVVDPSAHIRPEFVAQVVETKDGRTLTGLLAEENTSSITLLDAKNQRLVLAKDKIESMTSSPKSIMPENILDTLSDQDIADLFAYLRDKSPPKP
ncbi:MAG: hypothetical protein RL179_1182 [Planctomycetota bacterium]